MLENKIILNYNTNSGDKHIKNFHFTDNLDVSYASQHTFSKV